MNYLMWQLWLCLLGALLLGAALGWLLRGGGKRKLAKITKEWSQQFNFIEKERDAFAAKAEGVKQLNAENESLLGRLGSMEKGANLASDVLKDNKARWDDAEHHLLAANLLLAQRDAEIISLNNDLSGLEGKESSDQKNQQSELSEIAEGLSIEYEQENAKMTSKLVLKQEENQLLSDEIDNLTEKLAQAEKQLDEDVEKIAKLTDVYEQQIKSARAFKSQIIRSGSDLRAKLTDKETICEGLAQEIELVKTEAQDNAEKMRAMTVSFAHQEKTHEALIASEKQLQMALSTAEKEEFKSEAQRLADKQAVEKLNSILILSREKEQDTRDEMTVMQGLIVAHEQGSDELSTIDAELQQEIEIIKKRHHEDKKKIVACKDELTSVRERLQVSNAREQSAIDEMKMMQGLIAAHERGSDEASTIAVELQQEIEVIKKIKNEGKKKISVCEDELTGAIKGIQSSKAREQSALSEVEMIQALLVAQEEGNQQLLETKKQLQKALLNAEDVSVKQEERATKYKAELARKKKKQTQQSKLDITELEDLEKQLKRLQLDTKITTDNSVLGDDNRATKNESTKLNESYVIGEIEGIGKGLSKRLRKVGVHTTTDLLERCKNNSIDKHLMNTLNQGEKTIQSWCYMADLLRIKGINGKYANVLFLAGIHSTEVLAKSDVNEIKNNLQNRVKTSYYIDSMPTELMMVSWIDSANKLIK